MTDHEHCLVATSTVGVGWIIPLLMTSMYEIVTISLTLARIIWWRRRIPPARRVPLLDTLWKDGMGSINTGLLITSTASIIRQNVTQLQTALHSMLSTRIVLHLANSGLGVKNLHTTMTTTTSPSSQFPDDMQPQFTSVIRSDYELSTLGTARIGNV
ncbi:hypothetical protein ONZ45_g10631 [Pleurotus djamor]|nr:hypothetical protein ONZ45_g10631 [Pleurotus djamor]